MATLLLLAAPLWAADSYLARNQPDSIALLPPPPAPDSAEQAADLASARAVFQNTPMEEKERAEKYAALTPFKFTPAIGDFFQPGRFPKTETFLERAKASNREPINRVKQHWKRTRPYAADPSLSYGKPEPSFSYPSGHATVGMVQALVLAELFPEQREAILEIGRQIGWDRVLIGKHYPTDVYAGRTLGQVIMRELQTRRAFRRDLTAARAEVQAVMKSHPTATRVAD